MGGRPQDIARPGIPGNGTTVPTAAAPGAVEWLVKSLWFVEIAVIAAVMVVLLVCLPGLVRCVLLEVDIASGMGDCYLAAGVAGCLSAAGILVASADRHCYRCYPAVGQGSAEPDEVEAMGVRLALPAGRRAAAHKVTDMSVGQLVGILVTGSIPDVWDASVQAADASPSDPAQWVRLSSFIDLAALQGRLFSGASHPSVV
jgi:hypothetical protein